MEGEKQFQDNYEYEESLLPPEEQNEYNILVREQQDGGPDWTPEKMKRVVELQQKVDVEQARRRESI